ncbi:hypothetical protein [Deinococcus phoenicis]|uniref:hypothetical protein n=1 Tax=Deinococcus phoenicis TaxID=1476583 RepID=UPI001267F45F|nr:hypothetical protein [Deinococcus phoenicis]
MEKRTPVRITAKERPPSFEGFTVKVTGSIGDTGYLNAESVEIPDLNYKISPLRFSIWSIIIFIAVLVIVYFLWQAFSGG